MTALQTNPPQHLDGILRSYFKMNWVFSGPRERIFLILSLGVFLIGPLAMVLTYGLRSAIVWFYDQNRCGGDKGGQTGNSASRPSCRAAFSFIWRSPSLRSRLRFGGWAV
jgi:hypothetical protein